MQETYIKKEVIVDTKGNVIDFQTFLGRKSMIDSDLKNAQNIHDQALAELLNEVQIIYQQFPTDVPSDLITIFNLSQASVQPEPPQTQIADLITP